MPNDFYLATVSRLEPDITAIDQCYFNASAAISLKRIADSLEKLAEAYTFNPKDNNAYDALLYLFNTR
jgi:hypothetical protein